MKKISLLLMMLVLLGCATTNDKPQYIGYKLKNTGKSIRADYTKITEYEAKDLLESFDVSHHEIIKAAVSDREIKIHLYSRCFEQCTYIVAISIPCGGMTEHYFQRSNSDIKPLFTFIKSDAVLDECCFGPRRSWLRRMLNI